MNKKINSKKEGIVFDKMYILFVFAVIIAGLCFLFVLKNLTVQQEPVETDEIASEVAQMIGYKKVCIKHSFEPVFFENLPYMNVSELPKGCVLKVQDFRDLGPRHASDVYAYVNTSCLKDFTMVFKMAGCVEYKWVKKE